MALINTNDDFINACNWLIEQGNLPVVGERFIDANNKRVWDEQGGGVVIDITPDNTTLESALDNQIVILNAATNHESAKDSILTLAATAKQYSQKIADILAPVVSADFNGDNTDTRFAAIRAAVALQGAGFQALFHAAMEADTGLTTLILDATPTATQKQAYNAFVRSFCNTWTLMVLLG